MKSFCSSVESVDSSSGMSLELPMTCCQYFQISIGWMQLNCCLGTGMVVVL